MIKFIKRLFKRKMSFGEQFQDDVKKALLKNRPKRKAKATHIIFCNGNIEKL